MESHSKIVQTNKNFLGKKRKGKKQIFDSNLKIQMNKEKKKIIKLF